MINDFKKLGNVNWGDEKAIKKFLKSKKGQRALQRAAADIIKNIVKEGRNGKEINKSPRAEKQNDTSRAGHIEESKN